MTLTITTLIIAATIFLAGSAIDSLGIVGNIFLAVSLAVAFNGVIRCTRGFLPVLIRVGKGLSKGEIAIYAKGDHIALLKTALTESGLFKEANLKEIVDIGSLGRADDASVHLVYWHDWADDIDRVFQNRKSAKFPVIIYAPKTEGEIKNKAQMFKLSDESNVTLTNFRGRLLNDIVTSLITTNL